MDKYLEPTYLLDFNDQTIQDLINTKGWNKLDEKEKILQIYDYVRDTIRFGYNAEDKIPASKVLDDGYGQCNTKGILLMALLRAVKIPCRFHGFTVDKKLQKGIMTGIWYKLCPESIVHSWVEIFYNNSWLSLEGVILDEPYLKSMQVMFKGSEKNFNGYGVATADLLKPEIYWNENSTFIQKDAITSDLGTYDNPDLFFNKYSQSLNLPEKILYRNIVRHILNNNVKRIRKKV